MSRTPISPQMLAGRSAVGSYYRAAGGLNPAALLIALLLGAAVAVIGAFPYVYILKFIPFVKLNCICCALFGALLGVVPAFTLKWLKVRSLLAALFVCGLCGLLGLYAAWVVWEHSLLADSQRPTLLELATDPAGVVDLAEQVDAVGTWSTGSIGSSSSSNRGAVRGVELSLIWACEAAMLIIMPAVVGRAMLKSTPFCADCNRWCGSRQVLRSTGLADPTTLRQRLESGDFAYVNSLPPATHTAALEYACQICTTCSNMNTLTVTRKTVSVNKKGKITGNKSKVLIDNLIVTQDALSAVRGSPAVANPA